MNTANGKWLARLLVASNSILACMLFLQEPEWVLNQAIDRAGVTGHIAVMALVALGVLAVVDVLVNDLLPDHYSLHCAMKYRHTIYMLISLGCLSLIFVLVKSQAPSAAVIHYGMVAFTATMLAVFDVRDRMLGNPR